MELPLLDVTKDALESGTNSEVAAAFILFTLSDPIKIAPVFLAVVLVLSLLLPSWFC